MASSGAGGSLPPNFLLTPQQQSLLFAALNSNKQSPGAANPATISPGAFQNSAMQNTQASGFQESPYLDNLDNLDYNDYGDSSFDFSFANGDQAAMIGDIPETVKSESTENDSHEKRSHPDDEDDLIENDPKRRESTGDKKKPGRKPLTSEPSSKRKAQNRAAQRAFRERKEQHLKDLETKVEELEKASADANNENSALRSRVEQMTTELNQYKQKVTLMTQSSPQSREKFSNSNFGKFAVNGLNDVNFQFEFPKFGVLPGPPANKPHRSVSQPISPQQNTQTASPIRSNSNGVKSPAQKAANDARFKEELAQFNAGFTPSMSSSITNASRASLDSASFSVGGTTSSPSASSQSNAGPSSSCGTSPEPITQSPMAFKPVETLTTIGEEQPTMSTSNQAFTQFSNIDFSNTNFDWLAQQNGGQFDPQLFGDYREPQNNVLANPSFDDFFNDALDTDFFTPYNAAPSPGKGLNNGSSDGPKKNLIDQIDEQQDSVGDEPTKTSMSCNQIWEKLQACPNAQNGDFDLDALCSDLTKKAKCSGNGPVVGEADFNTILQKYMGDDGASCVASKLGISVEKDAKTLAA